MILWKNGASRRRRRRRSTYEATPWLLKEVAGAPAWGMIAVGLLVTTMVGLYLASPM